MRAIVLSETGGPEVLRLEERPDPVPAEDQVLVRVAAAGVNRFDLNQRAGGAPAKLPLIPGLDAGGVRADTGEPVLVTGKLGCYAELVAVPERLVWPRPETVDARAAAALGTPYKTAWWSLVVQGGLEEGETLLVQAGSSGTGSACVQLGAALGATVYATASPTKQGRLRELGAEPLAYDDPRVGELEADLVYDPVGADTFERSVAAIGKGGRVVASGPLGERRTTFDVGELVTKGGRIVGIGSAPSARDTVARVIELAAEGRLTPVVDRVLPLEQAAEAHRLLEAREVFGKIVLEPSSMR
jgi:NADPH:quinone reductase-like Zn-dependent oxidoreductase